MATFIKYNSFIDEIAKGGHNLATATIKCALTNTAPNAATDTVFTSPPPSAAGGYIPGGNIMTTTSATTTAGVFKLVLADTVWTATALGIGPFRYVIFYNSSASSKLIGYYDYTSAVTLADTDTFTVDCDPTTGVLTIT